MIVLKIVKGFEHFKEMAYTNMPSDTSSSSEGSNHCNWFVVI